MLNRIQVFKAGKHRAVDGKVYEFSEADVAGIAAAYDPALQMGPIVIGHPKTDDPAWGWVKGLVAEGDTLFAETEKVDPAFAEGVEAGRYRYVSSAFYAPSDARNPKPGAWYLRHVGYLGAQPPAVKGLQPAFAEAPEDDLVAFAAADASTVQSLFRGLRDWIIEDKGLEVADRVLPTWYIEMLEERDRIGFSEGEDTTPAPAGPETIAGEPPGDTLGGGAAPDELTERAAALDAREAEFQQREAAFAERERQEARAEDEAFLDGLVTEGRLPPGERDRLGALFARLGGDTTVAFAEADADPRTELRELLSGLGKTIEFAEVSASDGFNGQIDANDLARRAGELVDQARARGEHLSYAEAVNRVGRG